MYRGDNFPRNAAESPVSFVASFDLRNLNHYVFTKCLEANSIFLYDCYSYVTRLADIDVPHCPRLPSMSSSDNLAKGTVFEFFIFFRFHVCHVKNQMCYLD